MQQHSRKLFIGILEKVENIKIVSSVNEPQIKQEDSLNLYRYGDYNSNLLCDLPTAVSKKVVMKSCRMVHRSIIFVK